MIKNKLIFNATFIVSILCAIFFAYQSTINKLITTWTHSNTYGHGFLILPIVLMLIYYQKNTLRTINSESSNLALISIGLVSMLWFIGVLTYVNIVEQFILFLLPITIVWAFYGKHIVYALKFPLLFLFLSIPVGDFLIPYLQFITADISVYCIRLFGIPVFRDGMYIQIPNGNFLVAEACSGIRFLISTTTIGVLFSYLNFSKFYKQIGFVLLCVFVSIVGNGLRAFLIILIGHLSDMQAAVGFDHLVYGWVFFSFIIGILFVIGNYMADPIISLEIQNNKEQVIQKSPSLVFIALAFLLLLIGPALKEQYETYIKEITNKQLIKSTVTVIQYNPLKWYPYFPKSDLFTYLNESIDGNEIDVFVAEYLYETDEKELISWENRLFDPKIWSIKSMASSSITSKLGNELPFQQYHLVNMKGEKREVRVIYQVGDSYIANKILTKMLQLLNKLAFDDLGGKAIILSTMVNRHSEQALNKYMLLNIDKLEYKNMSKVSVNKFKD